MPLLSTDKAEGTYGLSLARLPSKNLCLNPIEPTLVHGKRHVSKSDCILSAQGLEARVYAYDTCRTLELHTLVTSWEHC